MGEDKTLGAKQVATRIGTDPKTFRKFCRQRGNGVGQGRRYDFPTSELPKIAQEFKAWSSKRVEPKPSVTIEATPKRKLKPGEEATPSPYSDEELELLADDDGLELEDDDDLEELDFGDDEDED